MKTKFAISFTFTLIILSLFTFSCNKDDDSNDPSNGTPNFYTEAALLDCPSKVVDLSSIDFQINQAYEYSNLIIAGGFDNMAIFAPSTNQLTNIDTIGVNQFLAFNGKLMICAEEGLFSMDAQQTIVREADQRCYAVIISADGTLLMSGEDKRILSWDDTQGLRPHTDPHSGNFSDLKSLIELKNGELWAINGSGKIARYANQQFIDFYDVSNIPINEFLTNRHIFMAAYEDGAVLVAKNGVVYQMLKYTNNQEWVTLFDSENITRTDETNTIITPSLTGILIRKNQLYVSTTLASCKGFQVFDLSKDELLSPEDYYPLLDSNFDSHCINGINYGASGDILTISNNQVLVYNCD